MIKGTKITLLGIIVAISFIGLLVYFGFAYSGIVSSTLLVVLLILLLYYGIFSILKKNTLEQNVLCDGRFYVFSAITAYSVIPPIYGVLSMNSNGGVRMRSTYSALTYTSNELFLTVLMSFLFMLGILFGVFLRSNSSRNYRNKLNLEHEVNYLKATPWFVVWVISTVVFLLPFFKGGFSIIMAGGTIADVATEHEWSYLWKFIDIFFSSEMMTVSAAAFLFYLYKSDVSDKKKRNILVILAITEAVLAYLTTRRARALSIIICALIVYMNWYIDRKGKLPVGRLIMAGGLLVFFYLLEVIMKQTVVDNSFANYLQIFDGVYAYDSLLLSTRETPSINMLSNVVYGLFRHIPVFGKYFIELFGFTQDVSPMYQWMASRFITYQYGGGLAYTPQLEAYLTLGYFGCFIYGTVYGLVFGKARHGITNLFVAAMAFSIARGNWEIVLSLLWPYGIIGYCFYDRFLFSNFKIKLMSSKKEGNVSNRQSYLKGD